MKSLLVGLKNKVHCYLATRPKVEVLVVLTSREEPDISLSIVNSMTHLICFIHARVTCIILAGSVLNIRNDFNVYIERVTSRKRKQKKKTKFHSRGKCTVILTNINSDWMSKACSGLCITLYYLRWSFKLHLGV